MGTTSTYVTGKSHLSYIRALNHKFPWSYFHILPVSYLFRSYAENSLLLLTIYTIMISLGLFKSSKIHKETLLLIMLSSQGLLHLAWLSYHVKLCELLIIFLYSMYSEYDNYMESSIHAQSKSEIIWDFSNLSVAVVQVQFIRLQIYSLWLWKDSRLGRQLVWTISMLLYHERHP